MFQLLKLLTNDKPVCKETFGKKMVMIYAAIKGFCDRMKIRVRSPHLPRKLRGFICWLLILSFFLICSCTLLWLLDIHSEMLEFKVKSLLVGKLLHFFFSRFGWIAGGLILTFLITACDPGSMMLPGPSGSSNSSSWKEDSFEMQVLMEPFSETETEGTSGNPPIPRVAGEEAGPSHQASIIHNASFESSLHQRIQRLENENTPFLLDKGKGEYWTDIKRDLDQAPSQQEYNRLLEFENCDLQIRELKHLCSALFRQTLSQHPDLLPKCIERDAESAVLSFLESQREEFEAEFAPDGDGNGINTHWMDKLEMDLFQEMADDLHKNGGSSYYFLKFLHKYFPD